MKLTYGLIVSAGIAFLVGGGCARTNPAPSPASSGSGVYLYVASPERSSRAILDGAKALNATEYRPSEAQQNGQVTLLHLTVPNEAINRLVEILSKEANDKTIYGLKNLYGELSDQQKPKDGLTNVEIKLIDVRLLP